MIIASTVIGDWLRHCADAYTDGPFRYSFIDIRHTHAVNAWVMTSPVLRGALQRMLCVPVHHCKDAYGAVLVLAQGLKVVYSGDTRPCMQLADVGRDADVLVHEVTA